MMKDAIILTGDESLFLIISAALAELRIDCGAIGEKSCRILIVDADDRGSMEAASAVRHRSLLLVSRRPEELSGARADAVLLRPVSTEALLASVSELTRGDDEPKKPRGPRRRGIELDCAARTVTLGADCVRLSENEFRIFSMLYENRGEPVLREALERAVNGEGTNAADVYICYLRRKLEVGGRRVIASVRGVGYKLL